MVGEHSHDITRMRQLPWLDVEEPWLAPFLIHLAQMCTETTLLPL